MAPVQKTPSILPEWETFKKNLPADLPYELLLPTAAEAGFEYMLQQTAIEGLADSSVLVSFQVFIGREGKLEPFDAVSHRLPAAPGAVSLAARLALNPTLIWLFFGRLPPQAAAAPEQAIDVGQQPGDDIVLPEEADEGPVGQDGGEYIPESAPISRREAAAAAKMPSLIDHLEPDGVPVFIDFDNIPDQFSTAEIIAQFLVDVDAAAVKFSSAEQVLALFTKNAEAVDFLKELGSPDDRTALKGLLDKHQARLEAAGVVREVKIPGGKGSTVARRRRVAA